MPRNMSFSMSTEAVRNRTKTVTRRLGWWDLKPGTVLCAVEKGMGLKKGEKVKRLGLIRVVSVRQEPLPNIATYDDLECTREGFPDLTPSEFIAMFTTANKITHGRVQQVNRIEFEYVEEPRCVERLVGPRPELPLGGCDYITEVWQNADGTTTRVNFPVKRDEEAPSE